METHGNFECNTCHNILSYVDCMKHACTTVPEVKLLKDANIETQDESTVQVVTV